MAGEKEGREEEIMEGLKVIVNLKKLVIQGSHMLGVIQ